MYTVLGATGNIGSVITKKLLEKGEKVRVVGRNAARLQQYVHRGAEAFVADIKDAEALTKALTGSRAAFLVNLSSIGAQAPAGTGPILGLHGFERKLNAVERLNVLHLRPAYFMENHLSAIQMIQMMGIYGGALKPDLKIPMIATRDIGTYAAERLLNLDFSGKRTQELLGERDLSMTEVAAVISRGIGKPDLRYVQFSYEQVEQTLVQMGLSPKTAAYLIEMFQGMNNGIVAGLEPQSAANTTATSMETFVKEVFAPAYSGIAVGA